MKIKLSQIVTIFIYFIAFVRIYYIDNFNTIRTVFMIFTAIFLIRYFKIYISTKYLKINVLLLCFLTIIIISALYNDMNGYRGVFYAIQILEVFLFFEYVCENNILDNTLRLMKNLTLVLCIVSDLILVSSNNLFISSGGYYLIGNKFDISYIHIFLLALCIYFQKEKDVIYKIQNVVIFVITIFITVKVDCSTGVIGTFILVILSLLNKYILKKLYNNKIAIGIVLFAFSFFLIYTAILNNGFVKYIISDVLNRDITLTGRTRIYEEIFGVIEGKVLLGYGYGNSYEILMKKIAAPNTQNALLECIFNYGIIGALMLLVIYNNIIKNSQENTKIYPIIAFVYMLTMIGMVEITLDLFFFSVLAIINGTRKLKKEENLNEM